MRSKVSVILAGLCLMAAFSGCYSTATGQSKVGVPFIKDGFESRYKIPVPVIVAAAREVLKHNGALTVDNSINNSLEAKVDGRTVYVRVEEVDTNVTRVVVQARTKSSSPDLDLASDIDKQIALRLPR